MEPLLSTSEARWLASPPLAFLCYLVLIGLLCLVGRRLAPRRHPSRMKLEPYASGEAAPTRAAMPGYGPFFLTAIFFALLHLGALVAATGIGSAAVVVYLAVLLVALLMLALG
jgi:NADH:ubiquinone oxidoreductase subunit 3 (subunit A)